MNRMIVRITGCSLSSDNPKYLAFEYMDGGELDDYLLKNSKSVLYRTLLKFLVDIAEGMMYLEREMSLVHGNLNCHNILRLENGDIKISDACFDPILQEEKKLTKSDLNKSCNWRAPEVLRGEKITHHSDSWSYGMTAWQIMSLSKPFGSVPLDDMLELIAQKTLPSFLVLPYCPKEIKDILESCWELVPENRNNFTKIRESLDMYKSGCRIGTRIENDTEAKGDVFPVPTYLLKRHYYMWKEEEIAECEEKERETKKLRDMKIKMWHEPASSAESSNSGGSSTESGYAVMRQSDTSGYGSTDSSDMQKQVLWNISTNEVGDCGNSTFKDDVEMIDLHENITVESLVVAPSNKSAGTTSSFGSLMEGNSSLLEAGSGSPLNDVETGKCRAEVVQKSSRDDTISVERNSDYERRSEDIGEEPTDCAIDFAFEIDSIAQNSSEKSCEKDSENVTEDVMEVANVLASMAHQRTIDQKRPRNTDSTLIVQKHPRRDSPTESSSTECKVSLKEHSNTRPSFFVDQKQVSAFADIDGCKITSGKTDSKNMQATLEPPIDLQDSDYTERKKRSHSVSEEIARMQKRAARRALDIPNPFNLGSAVPKNFLLRLKAPFSIPTQGKPEDISKYFISPPTKKSIDLNAKEGKVKERKSEDNGYKPISEIQHLENALSSLKAASPGQSGAPSNTSPKISISQSLTYVAPPNQQANSQIPEHSNYQGSISTYLANLGQPLVTGSPVLVPQLTVGGAPGQSMGTAHILQVLQAQQKMAQFTQNISRDKSDQEKPSEAAYMQTLFAILASKDVPAPEIANSQHSVVFPSSAAAQLTHALPSTTASYFIATKNDFSIGKANETCSTTIDSNPKAALSSTDIKQSGTDIVMIPIQSSIGQQRPQPTTVDAMRPFNESSAHMPTPLSVKTLSNQGPLFLDSKLSFSQPLLVKRSPSTNPVRAPHLILPKNLNDPFVRIEQSKDVKLASRYASLATRQYTPDSGIRILPSSDSAISEIKAEPSSPTSQSYIPLKPASPRIPFDNQHPLPFFKPPRRGREELKSKSAIIPQLGDLKVFRKEDLSFEKKLGEGQFGEVWKALLKFQRDGSIKRCPVAVKKLKSDDQDPLGINEEFKNEVKQMSSLNNDYIVKLIGVCVDSGDLNDPLIITEWMPHGSLDQFIVRHRGTIVEEILLTFAIQIAKGMEFLQSCRIVHRDLATRNVLVESRDRVKVCDFGLSRMFGEKDYYRSHNEMARIPVRWFAPESIKELKFTAESDVWSYGVTIWEMFELWGSSKEYANPYEDLQPKEILDFLASGSRLQKPIKCSNELWSIVIGCWRYSPDERHSFYRLWDEIRRLIS